MERTLPPGTKSSTDTTRNEKLVSRRTSKRTAASECETGPTEANGALDRIDRRAIVLIDARGFFRECFVRSARECVSNEIVSFSSVNDFVANLPRTEASLVILASGPGPPAEALVRRELSMLLAATPEVPVIVLSDRDDPRDAKEAIDQGARGYLSTKTAFATAMEAIRTVQAGGTYVAIERLDSNRDPRQNTASQPSQDAFTRRELAVIRALRQGRSNKVIAYDLNMCESTLKVHIRNIMKKLSAYSRTEVAIKSGSLIS